MTPAEAAESFAIDVQRLAHRSTAEIRRIRRRHSQLWRSEPAGFVLEAATALAQRPALRWAAWEFIRGHRDAFGSLDDERVAAFAAGLDSWDSVDAFGRILSGPAWVASLVSDGLIDRWARSPDRWLRRAALVSTVALNMPGDGGRGDSVRTLAVCGPLVTDRDDMVVKALSWALRALAVRDPDAVQRFLAVREAELAARVKREVGHKLRTGLKNPRRSTRPMSLRRDQGLEAIPRPPPRVRARGAGPRT